MSGALLRADEWDDALATSFNGLRPTWGRRDAPRPAAGRLTSGSLGELATFHVTGTPQRLARTARDTRQRPTDMLKLCIQRRGSAVIRQEDREAVLGPGSLAIYDLDRPYSITLDGDWRSDVIAFPRAALVASPSFIDAALCRVARAHGPGSVLISLVSSGLRRVDPASASLMGHAGLDLIKAALGGRSRADEPDAVRWQVETYIHEHLADPGLSPATVAAAHHMSERTLHRLFGTAEHSVAGLIRLLRLRAVLRDLRAPELARDSVARVASRWGYHDMPHFHRLFKAHYGMTPSEARRGEGPAGA